MSKAAIPLVLITLATSGAVHGWQSQHEPRERLQLKEEAMIVEYTATANEAVVIVEAEAEEALGRVEVQSPLGSTLLRLRSEGGEELAVQGFVLESEELPPNQLFRKFSEGNYDFRALSVDGKRASGSAWLSHVLPAAPVVTYPVEGSRNVPAHDLLVTWVSDSAASGYRLVLEQDENDGLTVSLPPGSDSFQVPPGILRGATESHVEVGAIGPNGNITLVEIGFTTR